MLRNRFARSVQNWILTRRLRSELDYTTTQWTLCYGIGDTVRSERLRRVMVDLESEIEKIQEKKS